MSWPKAPFLPAGPGQRNIRINAQPTHLKDILKHAIKCLIRDCAFKHGYIPVDSQTECLVRILVLLAKALDRPYYTERVQKDTVIQGVVCDLVCLVVLSASKILIQSNCSLWDVFPSTVPTSNGLRSAWLPMGIAFQITRRSEKSK